MDSIPRIRRELISRFEGLVRTRATALGISIVEFRDWVDGIVGEGIAIAIAQNKKWDPTKGDFLYWCFLKTRSLVRTELNNEQRYRKAIERLKEEAMLEESRSDNDLRAELTQILGQLTQEQQKALALYYLSGMTVNNLAEILNKKPEAVYGLLRRARHKASLISKQGEQSKAPHLKGPRLSTRTPEEMAKKRAAQKEAIDRLSDWNDVGT